MLEWILERLGLVIFLVIFISQIVRAMLRARKAREEHEAGYDETDEGRRVREIRERIRRSAAERGGAPTAAPPPLAREPGEPPVARPETTQLPEVFGGPLGKMLEELQRRVQPPAPEPPLYRQANDHAEAVRQAQLAEEIEALEQQRAAAARRAAHIAAAAQAQAQVGAAARAARERALGDLRDPDALRRAVVLREVLGTPVGLR